MTTIIRFSENAGGGDLFSDASTGFQCGIVMIEGAVTEDRTAEKYVLSIMQRGTADIETEDGRLLNLNAGEGLVIPLGQRYRWTQTDTTICYTVELGPPTADGKGEGSATLIRPSEIANLGPSAPPKAELLIGPVPEQVSKRLFADPSGKWTVGVWESTPYHRVTMPFPKHELMYLLSGRLELTAPGGATEVFQAGETVFLAEGTVCDWKTDGMSKIYCIYNPTGS